MEKQNETSICGKHKEQNPQKYRKILFIINKLTKPEGEFAISHICSFLC